MNLFTLITARGGSKRLPQKNILNLAGKPLIAWTIQAALKARQIQEVIVSTDSEKIASISKKFKAKVPFIRPAELSSDKATSYDVVKHALDFYKKNFKKEFEFLLLLQPTSPLRTTADIEKAIRLLKTKNADAVVSVCETDHSPQNCNVLPPDNSLKNFLKKEMKSSRSQDLPKFYRINGAIYLCRVEKFLFEKTFFLSKNIFAFIMEKENSIDIDTRLDFDLAETILNRKKP